MTALANKKQSSMERWNYKQFTLKSGHKAWENAAIFLELATSKVVVGTAAPGLLFIGTAAETVDATSADKLLNVRLGIELEVEWFANSEGAAEVLATDLGKIVDFADDATVSKTPTGTVAGRVWAVSAADGVAVEKLQAVPTDGKAALDAPDFVATDSVLEGVVNGAVYEIPETAAASTVTLPASPKDGDNCMFVADGTKNGHSVQYRDATGPANLTTALTASKRHLVVCVARAGKWFANAYVSP